MKDVAVLIGLVCLAVSSLAQDTIRPVDSMEAVVVRAYENNRRLIDVPASITVISKQEIRRFDNTSLVPAMNIAAGVRMEERSPGSYRLNIRGSTLRSPFGVRNVKVYYNDIPYTDPGGNTFFNQLSVYNIGSIEIVKGPGSSLYGAGTGGVILLNSDLNYGNFYKGASIDIIGGSFGSINLHGNLRGGSESMHHTIHYQYQKSEGYRDHTALDRLTMSWDGEAKVGKKGIFRGHFFQGDLSYETPGALNAEEYATNPRAARPRAGQMPSAEEAKASINQKLFLAGLNYTLVWDEHWQSSTVLYGAFSRLINPAIRNYERRTEPHFGSRSIIQYKNKFRGAVLNLLGGAEVQQGFGSTQVYSNVGGRPDTLQSDYDITTQQYSVFTQATLDLLHGWTITGGLSLNLLIVELDRLSAPSSIQKKKFNNEVAPRIAVLKKLRPYLSAYGSVARGYSPPTNAEILPSTGNVNTTLQAEDGINTELGLKGHLLNGRIFFDVNTFYFSLTHTIAQRRDAAGADYFVNAGNTRQLGVESSVSYRLVPFNHPFLDNAKITLSHTWHHFRYGDFEKIENDTADYSGNRLPSIPPQFLAAAIDLAARKGMYANITYYYSDPLPLNDANTAFAGAYHVLSARLGYRKVIHTKYSFDVFATADNLTNTRYSLGNDINAFGGRYYNTAPGANYSLGATMRYSWD